METINKMSEIFGRNNAYKDRKKEIEGLEVTKKNHNLFFENFDKLSDLVCAMNSVKESDSFDDFKISDDLSKLLKECFSTCEISFANKKCADSSNFSYIVQRFKEGIAQEWSTYIAEKNGSIIRKLTILKVVNNSRNNLDLLIMSINGVSSWPMNLQKIANWKSFMNTANLAIADSQLCEEIENFLEKLSNKSATITDLTPNIIEWLNNHGLESKIGLSVNI